MFNWNIFQYQNAGILVLETDETPELLLQRLQNPEDYPDWFSNLKHEKRKREFLAARIGMNILMQKNVIIDYKVDGQPFLKNTEYQISITHSGRYFALMCHPCSSVGIDLEVPSDKISKVITRFLSDKERTYLLDKISWAIAWSAKEAAFKILGHHATDFSESLEIEPFTPDKKGILNLKFLPEDKRFTLSYEHTDDYTLVYCIDNK